MVNVVNKNRLSKWVAGHNKFSDMDEKNYDLYCRTLPEFMKKKQYVTKDYYDIDYEMRALKLPTSFDSRNNWPNCIHPIMDQGDCGSCWAFGASEVFSDRLCIESNSTKNFVLSPQDLVSCDTSDDGCNGGYLQNSWLYMKNTGIVDEDCMPYNSDSGTVETCPINCPGIINVSMASRKHKIKSFYHLSKKENDIMTEIYTYGPVEGAFNVYNDFMFYSSGVYHHVAGKYLGSHAIKIIGWGITNKNVKYWICANSWGNNWGLSGYFWIMKGNNECGLESNIYAGIAQ